LQLTLERLWEEEARSDKPVLRLQTLEQLGSAAGIARRHLDQTMETLPAPQRALAIRLFRHLVTATGGKHAWRSDDLAEEIDADSRAEQQAADRMAGMSGGMSAEGRRLLGMAEPPGGPQPSKAAVSETLDKLAQGKARILRTQLDPRGQGPLFELYHDALARPVLSWVQEARVEEAERRFLVLHSLYQQAQLQEARAVSALARQANERGDAMTGMLAALAVLPRDPANPDRPVSNAASAALLDAWLRNREKYDLLGHIDRVSSVAFSPDGRRVVTGSGDNTARVWDLSGATPAATPLNGHRGPVWSVAFSPDGRRVVTGSDDNTARVWNLSGATPVATPLEGHRGPVTSVAFSPDGRRVATGSEDNTAQVWDVAGATPAATPLEGHRGPVTSVAFSPDGRQVVTGSDDNAARVWDLSGATPAATLLEGHRGPVTSVAFSPDERRVVTGSLDNTAQVWDLSGATPAATPLEGHRGWVKSVAFSPDGRQVVTGSYDNTARVWDLSDAIPVATVLEGHRGWVTSVAFSPNGRRVVTGSDDNMARLWDLSDDNTARVGDLSGATPAATPLEGHRGPVTSVAFSPDGRRVVTGSGDNTARVWETPPVEILIPLARAALTRCLTIAQRDALGLPVNPGAGQDRERVDPPSCP
jgi:uncharacterized protein with WD repeat